MPTLTELKERFKIENPAGWTYIRRSGGDPPHLIKLAPNREMIVIYEGGGFMKAEWVPTSAVIQGPYIPENFQHDLHEPAQGSKEALHKLTLVLKHRIEKQDQYRKLCETRMLEASNHSQLLKHFSDQKSAYFAVSILQELLGDIETLRDDPAHYDECHDEFGAPR